MALRVRESGQILCAAMHPAEPGDTYLHDGLSYKLTVDLRAIVTEPMTADPANPGRGGHGHHGEWWWRDGVPADAVIEQSGRFEGKDQSMFGLDKALKLPGEIAKQTARTAAQFPAVPFDVADKAREGVEEGIGKLTSSEERTGD